MENHEMLRIYRGIAPLIVNLLKKEIDELGSVRDSDPLKSLILKRKSELEVVLAQVQEDMENQ